MANARLVAVRAVMAVESKEGYSNLVLSGMLADAALSAADRALATRIFYGTLDRQITLSYILNQFLKKPLKKVKPFCRAVLETALYQIIYAERIPNSAAVNEAVKLMKNSKERYQAAFVNGVLRQILRQGYELPQGEDVTSLSVRYSCPERIVRSFLADYGQETAISLLEQSLLEPAVYLRVNTVKTTVPQLCERLRAESVETECCSTENALRVVGGMDVAQCGAYRDGLFHVQDLASQKALAIFNPQKNERVLDLCAAPGGKTFTMAEMMENQGEVTAYELHESRVSLIQQGAGRLGLSIVSATQGDSTVMDPQQKESFDAVLCDVPCSGWGVLRRKPELKYRLPESFEELEQTQQKILACGAAAVKKGGRLLYSTCTLRRAENETAVRTFLKNHSEFKLQTEKTFFPHIDGTDGFFCALFIKAGEEHT
ncbi:MAG: 16S rRNA (cytosine(967)-C(5))-methyltransferase RsmB [Clostridia bacterium]|nr:16S rRNA (cytosine(967)-C(5))-methyltransferase RsmB [Clostridia bacterium]